MSRNAFVPVEWLTADIGGEALRTLILISIYADAQTGECWPTNATLASHLGKQERAVQKAIAELKAAGLVTTIDGGGKRRKIRIESTAWFTRPTGRKPSNHVQNGQGSTMSKMDTVDDPTMSKMDTVENPNHVQNGHPNHVQNGHPNHVQNGHGPNKNTPNEHTHRTHSDEESLSEKSKPDPPATTTTMDASNLEPFESGMPGSMPTVRNAVESFRPRAVELVPTIFRPETRARILAVLGHESDQFLRKVTQEQADAGFPDWILGQASKNRTPVRLAFHLLKTAWREGWTNPEAEEHEKREARRKRLEALK